MFDCLCVCVYNGLRKKMLLLPLTDVWLYLNLHIAEQRLAVQQLVILPAPADLPHVAPPRHWVGSIVCISTQVAEVTCSLGGGVS